MPNTAYQMVHREFTPPLVRIYRPLSWQLAGRTWTATGYGKAIPSTYCVKCPDGKIRRIYVTIYSNSGTAWIKYGQELRIIRDSDFTDEPSQANHASESGQAATEVFALLLFVAMVILLFHTMGLYWGAQ